MDIVTNPGQPEVIVPEQQAPLSETELLAVIGTTTATGLPLASEQYDEMRAASQAQKAERAKIGSSMGGTKADAVQIGAQLPNNDATGVQI